MNCTLRTQNVFFPGPLITDKNQCKQRKNIVNLIYLLHTDKDMSTLIASTKIYKQILKKFITIPIPSRPVSYTHLTLPTICSV